MHARLLQRRGRRPSRLASLAPQDDGLRISAFREDAGKQSVRTPLTGRTPSAWRRPSPAAASSAARRAPSVQAHTARAIPPPPAVFRTPRSARPSPIARARLLPAATMPISGRAIFTQPHHEIGRGLSPAATTRGVCAAVAASSRGARRNAAAITDGTLAVRGLTARPADRGTRASAPRRPHAAASARSTRARHARRTAPSPFAMKAVLCQ